MHTEKEAAALWCPMVRVVNTGQTYNRVDPVYLGYQQGPDRAYFERQQENCNCIASRCAMWRWGDGRAVMAQTQALKSETGNSAYGITYAGEYWHDTGERAVNEDGAEVVTLTKPDNRLPRIKTGYCGLAGNPVGAP